jgi:cell division protein FtsL
MVRLLLTVLVLITALEVVVTRHESRRLFVDLQELEAERNALLKEWGQLQIEQATWATQTRIEDTARNQLQMMEPESGRVVVIAR